MMECECCHEPLHKLVSQPSSSQWRQGSRADGSRVYIVELRTSSAVCSVGCKLSLNLGLAVDFELKLECWEREWQRGRG
jgi:hypothetical protein